MPLLLKPHPTRLSRLKKALNRSSATVLRVELPEDRSNWPHVPWTISHKKMKWALAKVQEIPGVEFRVYIRPFERPGKMSDKVLSMTFDDTGLLTYFAEDGVKDTPTGMALRMDTCASVPVPEGGQEIQGLADMIADHVLAIVGSREVETIGLDHVLRHFI